MFDTIATTFNKLYSDLGAIIIPVAIVVVAVLAVKMLMGLAMDDDKAVKMSQRSILYTSVAVAIYYLSRTIVEYGKTLAGKAS